VTVTETRPALQARLAPYDPGIDLIVVDYRSPRDLRRFASSVPGQLRHMDAPVDVRIVLVDPTASDRAASVESASVINRYGPPEHVAVYPREHASNVGYNVACNAAGAEGHRQVVVCCNADVTFDDSSPVLATLYDRLRRHENWGMAGPRQVNRAGKFTAAGIFGTLREPKHRSWKALDTGRCSDLRTDAVVVVGSVFAMRRDVWDTLTACPQVAAITSGAQGPFLETKHWYGETWACYHAAAHGYDRVYDGTVWCRHEHGDAPDSVGWARRNNREDQRLFRAACDAHGIPRN
jgi:hypothetical protein